MEQRAHQPLEILIAVWDNKSMAGLPPSLHQYFWDYDVSILDVHTHAFLIMKRVLDRGKTNDVRWIVRTYGKDAIRDMLKKTKDLSRITATYWSRVLDVDQKDVPCLLKPYSRTRFGLSS